MLNPLKPSSSAPSFRSWNPASPGTVNPPTETDPFEPGKQGGKIGKGLGKLWEKCGNILEKMGKDRILWEHVRKYMGNIWCVCVYIDI